MMQIGSDKVVKVMMGTNVLFENTWKEIPYDGLFSKFGSIKYFDFDNRIFFKGEFTQEMVNAISTRNFNFPFFTLPEEFHNPHFLREFNDSDGFYGANWVADTGIYRIHRK